jgi:hypothetical protein
MWVFRCDRCGADYDDADALAEPEHCGGNTLCVLCWRPDDDRLRVTEPSAIRVLRDRIREYRAAA